MAEDDMFDAEEEGGESGGGAPQAGKKKIGFLPAVVIDILKWAAIVVALLIFIVVVVVVTVRRMNAGTQAAVTRLPTESPYEDQGAELLDWFSTLGDIRGTTSDPVRYTYIVNAYIGYEPENDATNQELLQREIQIKEAIAVYFSSRTVSQLEGVENRQRVKRELREEINRIMTNKIRDIAFDRYEFIQF